MFVVESFVRFGVVFFLRVLLGLVGGVWEFGLGVELGDGVWSGLLVGVGVFLMWGFEEWIELEERWRGFCRMRWFRLDFGVVEVSYCYL